MRDGGSCCTSTESTCRGSRVLQRLHAESATDLGFGLIAATNPVLYDGHYSSVCLEKSAISLAVSPLLVSIQSISSSGTFVAFLYGWVRVDANAEMVTEDDGSTVID